jgi:hypothetical protein
MSDAATHIAAWQAAGLLDSATAARLLAAADIATRSVTPGPNEAGPPAPARSSVAAMFGPAVTISEVFAYLGGAFLLAAWSSFMTRATGSGDPGTQIGAMALIAAAVLAGLGFRMRRGEERASRAAGVAFLLAGTYVGGAMFSFADGFGLDSQAAAVVASAVALATAIGLRVIHPSVLTQVGVLSWATAFAAAVLMWLQDTFFPEEISEVTGIVTSTGPDPIILVLASAAWWLTTAVIIALVGLREAQLGERDHDPAAARRAAISRFWAGLTAVIGLAMAVSRTTYLGNGEWGRVLEPIVGDIALLVLSAVLIERAFRRDATSFIYAAAIGLIVALTDFNVSYLSDSTEIALLIEGLILLGVGVVADRLRRQVGHEEGTPPAPTDPPTVAPPPVAPPPVAPPTDPPPVETQGQGA